MLLVKLPTMLLICLASHLAENLVFALPNNAIAVAIAVAGGNGCSGTPTKPPQNTTMPPCGDPDMGCVTGVSVAACGANNLCDMSVHHYLVQCYLNECLEPGPAPRCSCRNPDTVMPPPPVQQCGNPDDGCVNGVSGARCINGVCDTSMGTTVQCYLNDCIGRDPTPLCSCRNSY